MTNRATVIPHGLSSPPPEEEEEEMEKYTRVPVATETDREDRCGFFVCLKKSTPPIHTISTGNRRMAERKINDQLNTKSKLIKWL